MNEISQEHLKHWLWYRPDTGDFHWKQSPSKRIKPWAKAGSIKANGYWVIKISGKNFRTHRLAYLYVHGYLPKMIDHINGIKTDNRVSNLRAADKSKNAMNQKISSKNTSGFKGVSYDKQNKKFVSRIMANGEQKHLGCYATAEQAHQAYIVAAKNLHGEFARFQ